MDRKIVKQLSLLGTALLLTSSPGVLLQAQEKAPLPPSDQCTPATCNPPVANCNVTVPDTTPITRALLSLPLPCVATLPNARPLNLANLQQSFDFYSWQTFLALNAPATGGSIGPDVPTQWEQWKEIFEVFQPNGQVPSAWGAPRVVPVACQGLGKANTKVIRMAGKTPDVLDEFQQPFDTGPLIDQNGRYARYEILINQPMFEYIVKNGLYGKLGQAAFNQNATFPLGAVPDPKTSPAGTMGAIMVKAAWKVMGANDDASKFHTRDALVYTPPSSNPVIAESCSLRKMGLVGLHIGHKTAREPQWLWSTFEHADNVPSQAEVDANQLKTHYNFYKPGCSTQNCKVNTAPPRPWNPNVEPMAGGYASQITRLLNITPEVSGLNASFGALLPNTVWRNYILISTQWPTNGTSTTDPTGRPAPTYLANTTMESYIQGTTPQASSNCILCHNNATQTTGKGSDFTYILGRAK